MNFNDFLEWLEHSIKGIKDAAIGSFVYFLYGQVYQKKKIKEGIASFFMGTVFALYLSPVVQEIAPLKIQTLSFIVGLIGMRLTEALIDQDYKQFISEKLGLKKKEKETNNNLNNNKDDISKNI